MNELTIDELDVMMAGIAIGQLVNLDCLSELDDICNSLNVNVDASQYMSMLVKAAEEGIQGDKPSKMLDAIAKIVAETLPAVMKLSNSIN